MAESKDAVKHQPVVRLGDEAPDFKAEAVLEDGSIGTLHWHDYIKDSWAILFSHPRDFTPVCTTELGKVGKIKEELSKRNVKIAALSVDTADHHKEWIKDINETQQCHVNYPIVADDARKIAYAYGMLDQTHLDSKDMPFTVRGVFIIGPDKKVKLIMLYPASTGRNMAEILRVVDSLQLTVSHKVATPVDWQKGDEVVILPSVNNDDAKKLFPNYNTVRPWLRTTKIEDEQKA